MKKFKIKKIKMVSAKNDYNCDYLFYINNSKLKFK